MKDISELTVLVVDSGTFAPLAATIGQKAKRCLYHTPWEQEYVSLERCCVGDGFETFERVDDFLDPEILNEIGLAVFPDINFGGLQKHFRSLGIPVWGHMGADGLELYRTRFLKILKECGLPTVRSVTIRGITALSEHLKTVEEKYVKLNRYRANAETWHHKDWEHSQRELEREAHEFGPLKDQIVYVVQDAINGTEDSPVIEVGYDGWCVDGKFPSRSFQGVELKNKLYLGSELAYGKLPEEVRFVNEKIAPVLEEYGYRNFFATEIRIKDKVPYYIDPTNRMAGQTMEHLLETCSNLPEVINAGANGEILEPDFEEPFAAEATLHYHTENDDGGWKTFRLPEEAERWVKLYRCCFHDGAYHFPPDKLDELGVVIGNGQDVESAINHLKENFEFLKDEPVSIDLSGFAELLKEIKIAAEEGIPFSDKPLPEAQIALEK